MKLTWWRLALAVLLVCASARAAEDAVIADDGVTMSRQELEYIVARWPAELQRDAANDLGDRVELLNKVMASKKIAGEAERLTPEQDSEVYWQKELLVRNALQKFMVERFMDTLEPPDMTGLARERYLVEKDRYAWVPPERLSSHILIRCGAGQSCDRDESRRQADDALAELRAGADFEALVARYSQDPGSRRKKGRFDKWLDAHSKGVDKAYLRGVFSIGEKGGYSEVVTSRFGFHIIRLDDIRDGYHETFEEVKPKILRELAGEYINLSMKLFDEDYRFTDDLYIDGDVMEEIFNPYKTPE